ncbi:hypothetical protein [Halomicrococcus sp. NG-SE-24]|uniref:hypothetical protein n=1 Tax=Halomicrococcus sp. NG-SE-24 TaxID=3436928 RepID=UPI003D96AF34
MPETAKECREAVAELLTKSNSIKLNEEQRDALRDAAYNRSKSCDALEKFEKAKKSQSPNRFPKYVIGVAASILIYLFMRKKR